MDRIISTCNCASLVVCCEERTRIELLYYLGAANLLSSNATMMGIEEFVCYV